MSQRRKKVLLVDDEADLIDLLQNRLLGLSCEVIIARNGEQAVAKARDEKPDAIFLDIMMPGIDGFEVCQRLKNDEATKAIPIIMLTALSTQADSDKAHAAGADAYMTKPFDTREVWAKLNVFVPQSEGTQKQILIIEDEPAIAFLLSNYASRCHFNCRIDPTGTSWEKMIAEEAPDAIVLDIMLPKQNGMDILKQLKSRDASQKIPVFIFSASHDNAPKEAALNLGAEGYFTKDENLSVLFDTIQAHM